MLLLTMVSIMYSLTDVLYQECGLGFAEGPAISKAKIGNVVFVKSIQLINTIFGCDINVKPYIAKEEINTMEGFRKNAKEGISGIKPTKFVDVDFNTELSRLELNLHACVDELEIKESLLGALYEGISSKEELKALISKLVGYVKNVLSSNINALKTELELLSKENKEKITNGEPIVQYQPEEKQKELVKEEPVVVEQPKQEVVQTQPTEPVQASASEVIPVYPVPINTPDDICIHTLNIARFVYANMKYAIPYNNGLLYPCNTTMDNIIYLMDTEVPGDMINRYPLYVCNINLFMAIKNGARQQVPTQQSLIYNNQEQQVQQQPQQQQVSGPVINNQTGEVKVNVQPEVKTNSKYNTTKYFDSLEVEEHMMISPEQYDKIKNIVKFEASMLKVINKTKELTNEHFCYTIDSYTDHNNFTLLRLIEQNKEVFVVTDKKHPQYLGVTVKNGNVSIEVSTNVETDEQKQYKSVKAKLINIDKVVENQTDLAGAILLYNGISQSAELLNKKYMMFAEKDPNNEGNNSYYAISVGPNGEIDYKHTLASNVAGGQVVQLNAEQAHNVHVAFGLVK